MTEAAARPVYYGQSQNDGEAPTRADRWFYQIGNRWVAVEPWWTLEDWFDDDGEEWPEVREYPIDQTPPTGTLVYSRRDGTICEIQRP